MKLIGRATVYRTALLNGHLENIHPIVYWRRALIS